MSGADFIQIVFRNCIPHLSPQTSQNQTSVVDGFALSSSSDNGWMDDLQFYVLFNSILIILGYIRATG